MSSSTLRPASGEGEGCRFEQANRSSVVVPLLWVAGATWFAQGNDRAHGRAYPATWTSDAQGIMTPKLRKLTDPFDSDLVDVGEVDSLQEVML